MLIFLFGHPGVGKNYVGDVLEQHFDYYFWDADLALTTEMKEYIHKKQIFTQEMRDQFVQIIIKEIAKLLETHKNLVVAQALYKEKNRKQLAKIFPDAKFILIQAQSDNIIARLKRRNNTIDQAYAEMIQSQFEKPLISHSLIINDTN